MAAQENDQDRRKALLEIADTNRNILDEPPKTLREVCQWIIWFHLASRTYNRDGAGGQIDSLLQPYYENDLKNGIIDKDTAVYYLACFLINDPVYWQLGGPDENGKDQTSEISFLILEAADKINTSLNITVRVHDGPRLFHLGNQKGHRPLTRPSVVPGCLYMLCISSLSFCQNLIFFHFWHKKRMSFVKLAETCLIISATPFLLSALFFRSLFQMENTEWTILWIVSRLRADLPDRRLILSC